MPTGPPRPPAKPAKAPRWGLSTAFAGFAGPGLKPLRAGCGSIGHPADLRRPGRVRKKREKWATARREVDSYVFYVAMSGSMGPECKRVDSRGRCVPGVPDSATRKTRKR
jgi:hypothetical protein